MKLRILSVAIVGILFICGCTSVNKLEDNATVKGLKTGLYVGYGSSGAGAARWALLLKNSPDFDLLLLDGDNLSLETLKSLDMVVMPGGSSRSQYNSMKKEVGAKVLQDYVRNGGRYLGTCAGMSLILNEPDRASMMPYERTKGAAPGHFSSIVKLTPEGERILGLPSKLTLRYSIGPIVKETAPMEGVSCKVLGHFDCEMSQRGKIERPMYGTPAIFLLTYGTGKVFVTNCHPEIQTQSHPLLVSGIKLLTGKDVQFDYPRKALGARRVCYFCSKMTGKDFIEALFQLDARTDVDVILVTSEEIEEGVLEHADYLFVSKAYADDESLLSQGRRGELIRDFVARGGKIVRDPLDVK